MLFLYACHAERKATKQVAAIDFYNPQVLARYCSIKFHADARPGKPDTTYLESPQTAILAHKLDSLAKVFNRSKKAADSALYAAYARKDTACYQALINQRETIQRQAEQIEYLKEQLLSIPKPTIVQIHDTLPDTAGNWLLKYTGDLWKDKYYQAELENAKVSKKLSNRTMQLFGVIALLGLGVFLKIKRII